MTDGSAWMDSGRIYPYRCPSGRTETSKKIRIPLYGNRGNRHLSEWQMVVEDVYCTSVSSVRMEDVKPVESDDEMIRKLDRVSLRTLHNCMQSVFEDGPKRDRRLWLGRLKTSGTCKL